MGQAEVRLFLSEVLRRFMDSSQRSRLRTEVV